MPATCMPLFSSIFQGKCFSYVHVSSDVLADYPTLRLRFPTVKENNFSAELIQIIKSIFTVNATIISL
jgi:hypothetical protein